MTTATNKIICTILFCFLACIIFSCKEKKGAHWAMLTAPLSEWTCITPARQLDSTKLKTPYTASGKWETYFDDSAFSNVQKICFYAPDILLFELALNGKTIIQNENYTTWPSSFSLDSIFIYPMTIALRPYVIDDALFEKNLQKGRNKITLRIKGKNDLELDASKCAIYIFTDRETKIQTSFSNNQDLFSNPKLPTVYVNSDNYQIPNEPKVRAALELVCNDEKNCQQLKRNIIIEVRGFSSSSYDKKQFSFSVEKDSTKKEKIAMLGMRPSRKWILQGPYSDPSLIRNSFVYEMWRQMGYWSAQSRFVELVLNGNYQGVYLIMEKVEVNKSRLNLMVDSLSNNTFLIQLNRSKEGDDIIASNDLKFIVSDIAATKKNAEYTSKLTESIEQLQIALKHPTLFPEKIDETQLADFILIQEMVKNVDAYKVSTYFYKDDDRIDQRLKAGPVWDFDLSMGSSNIGRGEVHDGWIYNTDKAIPFFFQNKFDDPSFKIVLKDRYKKLRGSIWNDLNIAHVIDSLVSVIGNDAIARNFSRFQILGKEKFLNQANISKTYDEEIAKMKTWLHRRLNWLDEYFGVQTTIGGHVH